MLPTMSGITPAPPIAPLADDRPRPRVSVMLPTYRPDALLCVALRSVLLQALPTADMQICIVDDGSPAGLIEQFVRSVDPAGRIDIVSHGERLGIGGNWNRAISLARGRLIHLLHQDDWVMPGFYARLLRGFDRAPRIGMAFSRTRIVDGADRTIKSTSQVRWTAGVLDGWLPRIAERQRVQTPAVIVPRTTYEMLGGYRTDLRQALDWEMWVRIAAHLPVWYEPRRLAVYRRHSANETARLMAAGASWPDVAAAIRINSHWLPPASRDRIVTTSVRWYVSSALRTVEGLMAAGATGQAIDTLAKIPDLIRLMPGEPLPPRVRRRFSALAARAGRTGGSRILATP